MSWHYLQGQEEASSEGISWDGDAFVPSKSKTTLGAYCLPDSETESCHASRSGMTLRRSTDDHGEDVLAWYQGDSPVRTYQPLARARESTDRVLDSGPRWQGSLAKYNPHSYSWRTAQCSLFGGLIEFSETWPRWGMMRHGECWELAMSEPPTSESEYGYWPTPNVPNGGRRVPEDAEIKGGATPTAYKDGKKIQVGLEQAVIWWPTPTASTGGPEPKGKTGRKLTTVVAGGTKTRRRWPTPRSRMTGAASEGRIKDKHPNLEKVASEMGERGPLNPSWVEWLMGWPIGWTDLKPLETGRFQQWLDSHGKL